MKTFIRLIANGQGDLTPGRNYTATGIVDVNGAPHYQIKGISSPVPVTFFVKKKVGIASGKTEPIVGTALKEISIVGNGTWDKVSYAGVITSVTPLIPGVYLTETADAVYWVFLKQIPSICTGTFFPVIADKAAKDLEIGQTYSVVETLMNNGIVYYRLAEVDGIFREECFIKKRFFLAVSPTVPKEASEMSSFKRYNIERNVWEDVKFGGPVYHLTKYADDVYLASTRDTIYLVKVKR